MTTSAGEAAGDVQRLRNYIGGEWVSPDATQAAPVVNPATGDLLAEVPLSGAADLASRLRQCLSALGLQRTSPPASTKS
jgi:malonate-semialdehyde dehydrogenase (acetylating)/methylmalonate-semialdehyde dehydrogenase